MHEFVVKNGLINRGSIYSDGPVTASIFLGNLQGTASWANNTTSASHAESASWAPQPVVSNTASYLSGSGIINPYLDFFSTTSISQSEGRVYYDSVEHALSVMLNGGVNLQVGQEMVIYCHNKTGVQINNGEIVTVTGTSTGHRPDIKLAIAHTVGQETSVLGMATMDIPHGQDGWITTFGLVHGLNTNVGGWNEGDLLYLSPTVSGSLTNIEPTYPTSPFQVGFLLYKNPSQGIIGIKTDRHDADIAMSSSYAVMASSAISASWASASISSSHSETSSYATKTLYAELTTDPSGFVNRTDSRIHFDDATSMFHVYPTVSSFDVFINADKYTFNTTQSIKVSEVKGQSWYIFFDTNTKQLNTSSVEWTFGTGNAPVGIVYWDGQRSSVSDERHGISIDSATHAYFHETFGPRYASGLTGVFTGSGQTFYIESGDWYDDDLQNGPTASVNWIRNAFYSQSMVVFPTTTSFTNGKLTWNNVTTGATSSLATNEFAAWWIYAVNGEDNEHFVSIMPQRVDTSLANAKANALPENLIFGNFPYREAKLLYRVIWRGNNTWQDTTDYRSAQYAGSTFTPTVHSSLSGLGADDHPQYLLLAGRGGQTVTDQLTVTGITSSLEGTASWAISASHAKNSDNAISASSTTNATHANSAFYAESSLYSVTASHIPIDPNTLSYGNLTGSNNVQLFNGTLSGSMYSGQWFGALPFTASYTFYRVLVNNTTGQKTFLTVPDTYNYSSSLTNITTIQFNQTASTLNIGGYTEYIFARKINSSQWPDLFTVFTASLTTTGSNGFSDVSRYGDNPPYDSYISPVLGPPTYAYWAPYTGSAIAAWPLYNALTVINSPSASYAQQALSASWAPGGSNTVSASWASASISSSYSDKALSASYAPFTQTYQTSGSWASASVYSTSASFASQSISASFAETALVAQATTASYLSGSLSFTNVTNSMFAWYNNGTLSTSSFFFQQTSSLSASVPISASILGNVTGTASWASNAVSASWAPDNDVSASWASASISSSWALTASSAVNSFTATSANSANSATAAISASWASASFYAVSASWASGSVGTSTSASWASASIWSNSASFASSSVTTSYLSGSLSFTNVTNSFFPFYNGNTLSTNSFWIQQTASLSASVPISASLLGTASYANQALSASYAPSSGVPARISCTDITASQALIIGAGVDSNGVTLYVSASSRANTNIFELDDAYGNECFAIGPSGSLLLSASLDDPIILKNDRNNESAIFNTNLNSGNTASTDYIATSNLGSTASYQAAYYIDLGINSSGYNYGFVGAANDSYLFCSASNSSSLYIGNLDKTGTVTLFAGGYNNTGSGITVTTSSVSSNLGYQINTGAWVTRNGSYTIDNTDDGKIVTVSSGSSVSITVTTSSVNNAFSSMYYQSNTGRINFITASTAIGLRNRANQTGSSGQYAMVSLIRVSSTDFVLVGDTA